jgi:hypothetical protein
MITNEPAVICTLSNPSPIAYLNLYEEGDIWIKIVGCDACPDDKRRLCCGNCPMFTKMGCYWHLEANLSTSSKPWNCVVKPYPHSAMSFCSLEYKCVAGSKEGKIRRVCDAGDVFHEG